MPYLETHTVDNVQYDLHDKRVGNGSLQTAAQTLIAAINELKTGVDKTNIIGSGALNTISQTLIGAVNELKSGLDSIPKAEQLTTQAASGFVTVKTITPARDSALIISNTYTDTGGVGSNKMRIISNISTGIGSSFYAAFPAFLVLSADYFKESDVNNYYGCELDYGAGIIFLRGGATYQIQAQGKGATTNSHIMYALL